MTKSDVKLEFTGERFMPEVGGNIELEHFHRYLLAAEYVIDKHVLDIASGEGYGSFVLSNCARSVIGVDISNDAVAHANKKYGAENLQFKVGDCASIPLDDSSVDVVVSFETIEHHDKHDEMMGEIIRVLKPDGLLIMSSPDKAIHSDRTGADNPYHVKELYRAEFIELLKEHFTHIAEAGQRVTYGSIILADDSGQALTFAKPEQDIVRCDGLIDAEYIIAFASNAAVPEIKSGLFEQQLEDSQVIHAWREEVERRGARISLLESEAEVKERELTELLREKESHISQCELDIESISAELACLRSDSEKTKKECEEAKSQIRRLEIAKAELETEIAHLRSSLLFRLAKPLRFIKSVLLIRVFSRVDLSSFGLRVWRAIPVGESQRYRLKSAIFKALPVFFRRTESYRDWSKYNRSSSGGGDVSLDSFCTEPVYVSQNEFSEPSSRAARLVCFYLPQYHPIPENDEWWGKGFTEWRNVTRVSPQFEGHYQPKLPGELGFYDLRCPGVFERQIELAKIYGIEAFCYYFYWFAGKRLLEAPLLHYLESRHLDLPFCLCWANENWTRRWDGLDHEKLISQEYSPEDDINFISYVSKYLKDHRYLRIDGRPVLLVYRPGLLPDAVATTLRWREWCMDNGLGEIYLVCTQSFDKGDPRDFGFDAAVEFPPNNAAPPVITDQIESLKEGFEGTIYDWTTFVQRSSDYSSDDHDYKLFRGVNPGWDNEARKPGKGSIFLGATPEKYEEWLENAVADVRARYENPDEQIVFVNAWNEWAEGAYLEPDSRYGYAYLQATRNVMAGRAEHNPKRRVVIVSHDAHPHGAQHLALYLGKGFKEILKYDVITVLLGPGTLKREFEEYSEVYELSAENWDNQASTMLAQDLRNSGVEVAICNTTVSGVFVPALKEAGIMTVSLIHELPGLIQKNGLESSLKLIAEHAHRVVFPAKKNLSEVSDVVAISNEKTVVRPQGVFRYNRYGTQSQRQEAGTMLREKLDLPKDSKIVLAVGYADARKGVDLFLSIASELVDSEDSIYFVWVGHHDASIWPEIEAAASKENLLGRIFFQGLDFDTDLYYAGSDIYALTSREDPFPLVALEAMQSGLPIVAFADATGVGEVIADGCGELVDAFDTRAFADTIRALMSSGVRRKAMSEKCVETVKQAFSFRRYLYDLESFWNPERKKISVIVPNYQYEKYIEERLRSVLEQSYPLYELILLDDASSDASLAIAEDVLRSSGAEYILDVNKENSGSVFRQWLKGVETASGDFVWIAEADDLANPRFLEVLSSYFDKDPDVVIAYCQSSQISASGEVVAKDYLDYTSDISRDRWSQDYIVDGDLEVAKVLAIKNTIPNVSGVLFKREALLRALRTCQKDLEQYKVAGDWRVYVELLMTGKIAFCSESLNMHRRHERSVTLDNFSRRLVNEISSMQNFVAENFQVPPDVSDSAKTYLAELRKQFRL